MLLTSLKRMSLTSTHVNVVDETEKIDGDTPAEGVDLTNGDEEGIARATLPSPVLPFSCWSAVRMAGHFSLQSECAPARLFGFRIEE